MKKIYLIVVECEDSYYGDIVRVFKTKEEAEEILKYYYKTRRFAELYESELINNTGWKKSGI